MNHVKAFTVKDGGEPEDNRLSRDLSFVYEIPELLKDAFEAGKRGEELEFIETESEEL